MRNIINPYTDYYFEKYALLSLQKCYDRKYKHLNKNESPDWQSKLVIFYNLPTTFFTSQLHLSATTFMAL